MRAETPRQKGIILALTALAVAGVLIAKGHFGSKVPVGGDNSPMATPAVYLFLDESDQDGGCRRIYSLFEDARSTLPPGVHAARVNVNEDNGLVGKFGVRVLPTVVFVDKTGKVVERIEGEGPEVETRLRSALAEAPQLLAP